MIKSYIKLIRPHHYIKNGLIFLPLFFSGELLNKNLLLTVILGALAFCFSASAVYIFNDIFDVQNDRKHPVKCNRPIASGEVSMAKAVLMALLFLFGAIFLNKFAVGFNNYAWLFFGLYLLLNLGYSVGLKKIPILDVAILVFGFLIRVLYGGVIIGIEVSNWLSLTVISMALYLSLGKRRNEIKIKNSDTRNVLKYYNYSFLDKNMYMAGALTIVFYSMWCVSGGAFNLSNKLIWTVPVVILINMKYSLDVEGNTDGDPVSILMGDKILLAMMLAYIVLILLLIYPVNYIIALFG